LPYFFARGFIFRFLLYTLIDVLHVYLKHGHRKMI
jgi:hypothetical protein